MPQISDERALWIANNVLPHEPALRAQLARRRLPDDLEADDVVQEVYGRIALLETVADIRYPRAFLFTIARNLIASHVRHLRVVSIRAVDDLDAFGIAAGEPSPEIQVSDREQLQLLAVAVSELAEPSRTAFLMRVMDELSHREIGERLGLSENAVQKNIAKSLIFLMARLGRGGNGDAGASREKTTVVRRHDGMRDEHGD